jgi:hypothetical protein
MTHETTTHASTNKPLTIDTKSFRELWLPSWREHMASLDYMDKACRRALSKKNFQPLHTARMAVRFQMDDMARVIRDQGGLLLIGGAA